MEEPTSDITITEGGEVDSPPSVDETETGNDEELIEKTEKLNKLPLARIKTLIKADPDVTIASQESVFLISKATELFIEYLTKDVYRITQSTKRKTIQRKDLDMIIEANEELAFLEGTLDLK